MPVLRNVRHERIAQDLAAGKTKTEAYVAAGYTSKDPAKEASRYIARHKSIDARVREISIEIEGRSKAILDRAAAASATSKGYIMGRLHEVVERCMQSYPVLDAKGEQVYVEVPNVDAEGKADGTKKITPAYAFDSKGATRALHLLGLEHGMFAQRLRVDRSPFDGLPAHLISLIYDHLSQARGRTYEHSDASDFAAAAASLTSRVDRTPSA